MKLQLLIALGLVSGLEAYAQNVPKTSGTDTLKTGEKKIDEVVITALGIKKEKKALGYAVQEVKGDVFEKAKEPNYISVLKGPTASALYGSVGKDGAIMITTKKGKKGKLTVSFNNSTMFQTSFIRIPEVQTTYGGGNNGKYAYINGQGSGSEGGGWIWGGLSWIREIRILPVGISKHLSITVL